MFRNIFGLNVYDTILMIARKTTPPAGASH
jgi:hypothetical protein